MDRITGQVPQVADEALIPPPAGSPIGPDGAVPADDVRATAGRKRGKLGRLRIICSLAVVACYVVAAVIGPILLKYDPVATELKSRLKPPGTRLPDGSLAVFGTDQVGQDVLAQMMQGARVSITVGVATLVLAGLIGVAAGLAAGYFGGWLDAVLMRLADVQLTFPSILLAIFIASILGPSVVNVVIVLAISNWVTFARVTRSQVLGIKERDFVDATRTLHPAVRGRAHPGRRHGGAGPRDPGRGVAELPRPRHAGEHAELGHDHRQRPGLPVQRVVDLDHPRHRPGHPGHQLRRPG
jgi:hypothetical protein